jgi:hypothetical protein
MWEREKDSTLLVAVFIQLLTKFGVGGGAEVDASDLLGTVDEDDGVS